MKKILISFLSLLAMSCQSKVTNVEKIEPNAMNIEKGKEIAIFAGGCFWCTEAVFLELNGVESIKPGYTGGKIVNPTYEEVCSGTTGHAEGIKILFDPSKISYEELLEVFFATHDPTTINQQGADVGTQYRSEIFCANPKQKQIALAYIAQLNKENTYGKKVVTKVSDATTFYIAEDYHQNYYNQNKKKSYCNYVITPKVDKVRKEFKDKLKK
ncbi:Peptide methionine sulfoxide reductase MsrA [Flavobacterium psychrophilum]|uniref:peptide-methionine (S)-S-oxide reductase MsrA n=1 Tax=Flavobacterium psychrophilum TaxID=96345 RepID=UPI000B7C4AD7|nr:peptide-methionine (S)-S-oxide reductase MsrA [Flavobacterium psychrophilum]SNB27935.1 Peptide methionine sulfoxide reductase MsrA [Flavobacterium psychrophilum]